MPIHPNHFIPRPGLVNQQGRLPDPSELVCIDIPKVFDNRLIKHILVYGEGPDTNRTDSELRSNPLVNPRRYLGSRDFNIELCSVDMISLRSSPGYKKVIICYVISFWADYIDTDGINRSELYEINRTDVIEKFYSPDPVAQISAMSGSTGCSVDSDTDYIKVEMVAEALSGEFTTDDQNLPVLDITLGYYLIVKYELIVQLLIPAYDYCPNPEIASEEDPTSEEDVFDQFENAAVPQFYPDQSLEELFPEFDNNNNSRDDRKINFINR
jgi:hypothetical protein